MSYQSEFLLSAFAGVLGGAGTVYAYLTEKQRPRKSNFCYYRLLPVFLSLLVLNISSTIERGRLSSTKEEPHSLFGVFIASVAAFSLYSLLFWATLLAHAAYHESQSSGETSSRPTALIVKAAIPAILTVLGFLIFHRRNFLLAAQLGTSCSLTTPSTALLAKYSIAFVLTMSTLIFCGLGITTAPYDTKGSAVTRFMLYSLVVAVSMSPVLINGFVLLFHGKINGFIGALECAFPLLIGIPFAMISRSNIGDPTEGLGLDLEESLISQDAIAKRNQTNEFQQDDSQRSTEIELQHSETTQPGALSYRSFAEETTRSEFKPPEDVQGAGSEAPENYQAVESGLTSESFQNSDSAVPENIQGADSEALEDFQGPEAGLAEDYQEGDAGAPEEGIPASSDNQTSAEPTDFSAQVISEDNQQSYEEVSHNDESENQAGLSQTTDKQEMSVESPQVGVKETEEEERSKDTEQEEEKRFENEITSKKTSSKGNSEESMNESNKEESFVIMDKNSTPSPQEASNEETKSHEKLDTSKPETIEESESSTEKIEKKSETMSEELTQEEIVQPSKKVEKESNLEEEEKKIEEEPEEITHKESVSQQEHQPSRHREEEKKNKPQEPVKFDLVAIQKLADIAKKMEKVADSLKQRGVGETKLIVAVDCTASNIYSGKKSFGKRNLHDISKIRLNFYEQVFSIMGNVVKQLSSDGKFPVYLFGDAKTKDKSVRPLYVDSDGGHLCKSVDHALKVYRKTIPTVDLSGPTSFKPIIQKAIELAEKDRKFHLLIIIGDGAVTDMEATVKAIQEASDHAIAILMVGVGDGDVKLYPKNPWEGMKKLDSELPDRKFDNFSFVHFRKDMKPEEFAELALEELPEAYEYCKSNGLIDA